MLHKFFEEGDWFAPKKLGYGAGLPIAWQGWALLGGFIALMVGVGAYASWDKEFGPILAFAVFIPATISFVIVVKRRTRGGWKWRGPGSG